MRISDVSIRNSVFAWMLFAAFIIFGAVSFSRLGISQLPDVDFPIVNVMVTLEGAAPEVMETTVVDPIEDSLSSVEGAQNITSVSKNGVSNITIEFALDRNIDSALQEVQTKVAQAQKLLPPNVDPPVITKTNPDDQPILWLALTSEKNDPYALMSYAKDVVKDRFTSVDGVGDVLLGGYTDPAMRVWVDAPSLKKHYMSIDDVLKTLQSQSSEVPGGLIQTSRQAFNVRTLGEARTAGDFEQLVINQRVGSINQNTGDGVTLGQVAKVKEDLAEVYRLSRFDGVRAIGLGIKKQTGANSVAVARAVKAKIADVQKILPPGMKIQINFDSSRFIDQSVHEMITHLALAVVLTSLVCWIFLGSLSATFNVLLAIPTSIMGAFVGLYFFGFTLNTFTLLGLTLAIGIVVDDAIMVLENIFRHNEKGEGVIESSIVGAREITFAAVAASIAILAIFLPVIFMQGVIGKFFLQYGLTISLAVVISLIESLTITPMRTSTFVHAGERRTRLGKMFESLMEKSRRGYLAALGWTLRHRGLVLASTLLVVGLSFISVKFLNKEMTPAQDQSLFMVRVMAPVGSSLEYTDGKVKEIEKWLKSRGELDHLYASVGGFGGGGGDTNSAVMFVTLKDKEKRELSQAQFMQVARKELAKIPDIKVFMMDLSSRGFATGKGYPVEFVLAGPDWAKLAEFNRKLKDEMARSDLMTDVDSDYLEGMPEIQITPNRKEAALRGVSVETIGTSVNALIGGVRAGQYTKNGHRYDIYVQLEKERDMRESLPSLLVGNAKNNLIPLAAVTTVEQRPSLQQITRANRQRAITVYANLKPGASQQDALDFVAAKAKEILPADYYIENSGAAKTFRQSLESLFLALGLGLIVAYMVLATQFNSFIDPVTVLMALPFSFSGALFALLITHQTINMYSMIGLLLLMGIVKKNSILLIDFTNHVRDQGTKEANQALLEACPIRLRPIIMTSFATIAAAVPSALATGAGSEAFRPMAITLIGGVLVSTLLTLFVVPATYSLLDRFRRRDVRRDRVQEAFEHVDHPETAKVAS